MSTPPRRELVAGASDEQKRAAVYRHPDAAEIHALLPEHSAAWISAWLEERYPLEDEDGYEHPDARRRAKLRLSERSIEKYRRRFLPELTPGVDVLPGRLQEIIGYLKPQPMMAEIRRMDALQEVALHNLAQAMAQDEELEMVQPLTNELQKTAMSMVASTAEMKAKLGVEGYEFAAQKLQVDQTSRNVNVELHGRVDPVTGELIATEPAKVAMLADLLGRPAEERAELMETAAQATRQAEVKARIAAEQEAAAAAEAEPVDADVVEEPS